MKDSKMSGKATPRLLPRSGVFDLEADLVGAVVHVVHGHHALDLQIPGPVRQEARLWTFSKSVKTP